MGLPFSLDHPSEKTNPIKKKQFELKTKKMVKRADSLEKVVKTS